jgi:hypothetical protein
MCLVSIAIDCFITIPESDGITIIEAKLDRISIFNVIEILPLYMFVKAGEDTADGKSNRRKKAIA